MKPPNANDEDDHMYRLILSRLFSWPNLPVRSCQNRCYTINNFLGILYGSGENLENMNLFVVG